MFIMSVVQFKFKTKPKNQNWTKKKLNPTGFVLKVD